MQLSKEQEEVVKQGVAGSNLVVNAVAGSGKTSTMRSLCEAIPDRKVLYFVFNASARKEAKAKFPMNATCHTLHSLAWFPFGNNYQEKMKRPRGRYVNVAGTASEVAKKYKAKPLPGIAANAVARLAINGLDWFETSAHMEIPVKLVTKGAIEQILRLAEKRDKKHNKDREGSGEMLQNTKVNERNINREVVRVAKLLWADRINLNSKVLITHNTYLKLFHLSKPELNYDVIIADEFQDVGGVAIDLLKRAQKVGTQTICVGDSAQAIYQWNHSLDGLNIVKGDKLLLSTSFRFGQRVADAACDVLDGFIDVKGFDKVNTVIGDVDTSKPFTWLFRTNMSLLQEAVSQMRQGKKVYIQANIKSFLSMTSSMQALKMGDMKKVKHSDVLIFETWDELVEEAETTGGDLRLVVNLLKSRQCGEVLDTLRTYQIPTVWDIFMTTAHKAKGSEWDQVRLAEDFKPVIGEDGEYEELSEEERNLLYVALTRAKLLLEMNTVLIDIIQERASRRKKRESVDDSIGMTDTEVEVEFISQMTKEIQSLEKDYLNQ